MQGRTGSVITLVLVIFVLMQRPFDGLIPVPEVAVEPGPATTRLVEPLLPNGHPDIVRYWNDELAADVTAPTNAFPALVELLGRRFAASYAVELQRFGCTPTRLWPPLQAEGAAEEGVVPLQSQRLQALAAVLAEHDQLTLPLASPVDWLGDCESQLLMLGGGVLASLGSAGDESAHRLRLQVMTDYLRLLAGSNSLRLVAGSSVFAGVMQVGLADYLRRHPQDEAAVVLGRALADGLPTTSMAQLLEYDRWLSCHYFQNLAALLEGEEHLQALVAQLDEIGADPNQAYRRIHAAYDRLQERYAQMQDLDGSFVAAEMRSLDELLGRRTPLAERMLFGSTLAFRRQHLTDICVRVILLVQFGTIDRFVEHFGRSFAFDPVDYLRMTLANVAFRQEHRRIPAGLVDLGPAWSEVVLPRGLQWRDGWAIPVESPTMAPSPTEEER